MIRMLDLSSAPWSWRKTCHNMKVSGILKLTTSMEEAIRYGVTAAFTKGTGPVVKLMGEVDLYMQMATSIMGSGRTISLMVTENTLKMMAPFTRGPGSTTKNTVKAKNNGRMVQVMTVIINLGRKLVTASFHGNKEPCMKDTF